MGYTRKQIKKKQDRGHWKAVVDQCPRMGDRRKETVISKYNPDLVKSKSNSKIPTKRPNIVVGTVYSPRRCGIAADATMTRACAVLLLVLAGVYIVFG